MGLFDNGMSTIWLTLVYGMCIYIFIYIYTFIYLYICVCVRITPEGPGIEFFQS